MIELSRKHGAYDLRWPTATERFASRARAREAVRRQSDAVAAETWDNDGRAPAAEPVAVRPAA